MAASIEKLEAEKKSLEIANARMIENNRSLLDDLEELNNNLSNSDAHVRSLTSALESTRDELERLNVLATRSSRLETQLLEMETEQTRLQSQLVSTELDCRSATQRWKFAERTIATLQEYVDRIEEEAREERERHEEALVQFKQRRLVERELENAAGRLKGAAAATTLGRNQGSNSVVSHFVTDILQDNANLQMGIVELRGMLANSNEEVEALREQMLLHQPALPSNEHGVAQARLRSELAMSSATEAKSELHVYHHYQPGGRPVRDKFQGVRRPKKTRNFTSSELLTSRSGFRTPRTPSTRLKKEDPAAALGLQPSSSKLSAVHRWSTEASQAQHPMAPSTVPSSPQSIHQNRSIFDTIDSTVDFSRPTSPESTSVGSPGFFSHRRMASDASFTSLARLRCSETKYSAPKGILLQPPDKRTIENIDVSLGSTAVLQEIEDDLPEAVANASQGFDTKTNKTYSPSPPVRPRLHRSASHESILSIPPSPLRHPPSHLFNPVILPSRAVLTHTPATALPSSHALRLSSSTYNRTLLSNLRGPPPPPPPPAAYLNIHPSPHQQHPTQTFGKRVGGWVLGKWGLAPMASTGDLRAQARLSALGTGTGTGTMRAAGVNQKGSIESMADVLETKKTARAEVQVGFIDEGLLKESLGEG